MVGKSGEQRAEDLGRVVRRKDWARSQGAQKVDALAKRVFTVYCVLVVHSNKHIHSLTGA